MEQYLLSHLFIFSSITWNHCLNIVQLFHLMVGETSEADTPLSMLGINDIFQTCPKFLKETQSHTALDTDIFFMGRWDGGHHPDSFGLASFLFRILNGNSISVLITIRILRYFSFHLYYPRASSPNILVYGLPLMVQHQRFLMWRWRETFIKVYGIQYIFNCSLSRVWINHLIIQIKLWLPCLACKNVDDHVTVQNVFFISQRCFFKR